MDRDQGSCSICGTGELHELAEFAALSRVTSDSRILPPGGRLAVCMLCGTIQKIPDAQWQAEIAAVYADFALDHQSDGEEQIIFDSAGVGLPRSRRIVDFLAVPGRLPAPRQMLDFGCGRGATLKVFAEQWPQCALYGAELSNATEAALQAIPGFRKLYTDAPGSIYERFDLVLFVHSFAHVIGPVDVLRQVHARMEEGGTLFIQTPDAARNLFYVLVADALTHFTADALHLAAARAGFRATLQTGGIAANELTYLATRTSEPVAAPITTNAERVMASVTDNIAWLRRQIEIARRLSRESRSFGIFGSSMAGSWLAGELGERFDFFVDEDRRRLGKTHMGRPIIGVDSIPAGAAVFIPLAPNVAEKVAGRLEVRGIDCYVG